MRKTIIYLFQKGAFKISVTSEENAKKVYDIFEEPHPKEIKNTLSWGTNGLQQRETTQPSSVVFLTDSYFLSIMNNTESSVEATPQKGRLVEFQSHHKQTDWKVGTYVGRVKRKGQLRPVIDDGTNIIVARAMRTHVPKVELTLDQIAEKFNIDVRQLHIKK